MDVPKTAIIIPTWDRTGSTFLANAVMGFIAPDRPVIASDDLKVITGDAMIDSSVSIVKSHNMNIGGWVREALENDFKFYGITINRPEKSKVLPTHHHKHNIIQFEYSDILETNSYTVSDIIDFLYNVTSPRELV